MKRSSIITLAFLLTACGHHNSRPVAAAAPTPGAAPRQEKVIASHLTYLPEDAIDQATVLPPPPRAGQAPDQTDLAGTLRLQDARTQADCARANSEAVITLAHFYGHPFGPLSDDQVAKLDPTFTLLFKDANFFVQQLKVYWHRPRPFKASADVHPCLPLDPTGSYPSGHSTAAHLFAKILGDLYPASRDAFEQRADQIAQDRVLGGMHYPSDIAAGASLAWVLYEKLQASAAYQVALAKLK